MVSQMYVFHPTLSIANKILVAGSPGPSFSPHQDVVMWVLVFLCCILPTPPPAVRLPPLLYFNSLYQLTVSLSISLSTCLYHIRLRQLLALSICFFAFISINFSLSLYQFVFSAFVSINFSLSPCSLSTSLYHIHLYELFSTTFISINFSLSTCPLCPGTSCL